MNLADFVILGGIALWLFAAVIYAGNSKGGCHGNCDRCQNTCMKPGEHESRNREEKN